MRVSVVGGGPRATHASYGFFFFQAEDGIRDLTVTGVQTCALPISLDHRAEAPAAGAWAVRWLEGRPAAEAQSVANRFRLALAYYVGGRVDDAQRVLEGLASERAPGPPDYATTRWISVITGDSPDPVTLQGFLGVVAARQQQRAEALRADRALQAMSPRYLYGRNTMWRARVQALLGGGGGAGAPVEGGVAQGDPAGGAVDLFPS